MKLLASEFSFFFIFPSGFAATKQSIIEANKYFLRHIRLTKRNFKINQIIKGVYHHNTELLYIYIYIY